MKTMTWNAGGLNFNSSAVTLGRRRHINFDTAIGYNSSSTITENGANLTVNLQAAAVGTQGADKQASYTLTAGKLNFATAASANAFNRMRSADSAKFNINGGTIDNSSGSAMTLDLYQGTYSIGGDFTFTGSSDLNFGTAAVALTASRQITVANKTLTIGGIISGSTFGLSKAGTGTLTLSGANNYTGATAIKNGTLALGGGNDRLPTGTTVTLGDGTTNDSGILKLDSRSQTLAGLLTAGTGTGNRVVNGNATAATLTVNIASGQQCLWRHPRWRGQQRKQLRPHENRRRCPDVSGANTYTGALTVSGGG